MNVSGPYHIDGQTIRVAVGLVDPAVQGGFSAPGTDSGCTGTVTLRVMDAANPEGPALAERTDVALGTTQLEALEYVNPSGIDSEAVYTVIAAKNMDVDGKTCILRGRIQVRDTATSAIEVEQQVYRQDFGQVQQQR